MIRLLCCLATCALVLVSPPVLNAGDRDRPLEPAVAKLRERRVNLNEKGNASEFVGTWRMKLPAGFEYDVTFTQEENGLLRMTCPGHALNLLGDFACAGNELRLIESRQERVDDYIWVFRTGKLVLAVDEQHHGASYRGATLTRLP